MLQKRRFIPHLEKWGHSRPFRVKEQDAHDDLVDGFWQNFPGILCFSRRDPDEFHSLKGEEDHRKGIDELMKTVRKHGESVKDVA